MKPLTALLTPGGWLGLSGNEGPEGVHGDEALPVPVVDTEGVLQLPLNGVDVQVLGAQLAELDEFDLPGSVLVDLEFRHT